MEALLGILIALVVVLIGIIMHLLRRQVVGIESHLKTLREFRDVMKVLGVLLEEHEEVHMMSLSATCPIRLRRVHYIAEGFVNAWAEDGEESP